jgi:F0F1-type ATP synthase membrane subunit c/vacuolar-type H+-ATPase subunit K
LTFLPLTGCAVGTGIIFGALLNSLAYAPDREDSLFNYATMGFAFIETFAFILVLTAMFIVSF